ncbi:MAG: hypothetical protein HC851_13775 [Acaryochloris sp. RU_4_1]|nr:hypothetical protein [Acaryochloris sp. RU_4_1]
MINADEQSQNGLETQQSIEEDNPPSHAPDSDLKPVGSALKVRMVEIPCQQQFH